jgi:hypothetical protein
MNSTSAFIDGSKAARERGEELPWLTWSWGLVTLTEPRRVQKIFCKFRMLKKKMVRKEQDPAQYL